MTLSQANYTAAQEALNVARIAVMESPEYKAWLIELELIIEDEKSGIDLEEIPYDTIVESFIDAENIEEAHANLYNVYYN